MVWTSPDGVAWTGVEDTAAFEVPGVDDSGLGSIHAIAVRPDGGFVAAGRVARDGPISESEGAVFTSDDGVAWHRLADPAWTRSLTPASIAASRHGVVLGSGSPGAAAPNDASPLGTSDDGLDIHPVDALDVLGSASTASIGDVAWWGDRVLAVGSLGGYDGQPSVGIGAPPSLLVPDRPCPTRELDLATLASLSDRQRAACLDGTSLRVRAWARLVDLGCGAAGPVGNVEPVTLDDTFCGPVVQLSPARGSPAVIQLAVEDETAYRRLARGDGWFRVRIRIGSDPAACPGPLGIATAYPHEFSPVSWSRAGCASAMRIIDVASVR
jgi:hypothetical protein